MPINNTVKGDLVKLAQQGRYNAIIHGCNCNCVMGAGIAPQIAKAFPDAEKADNGTIAGDQSKLGSWTKGYHYMENLPDIQGLFVVDKLIIFNMYTQAGTGGRYRGEPDINYYALTAGFGELNRKYGGFGLKFGIPQIGAGLAGGHWDAIKCIIDLSTPDLDIELVMYQP